MIGAEFFPTPAPIARRMLAKVSKDAVYFLDPSAGKGDLAEAIRGNDYDGYGEDGRYGRHYRSDRKVDCIEQSPELISVLIGKGFPVVGFDWLTYTGVSYYDCVCMNPPFSNGDDHLLRAWDFLHSGEIVCLLNEETIRNPHTAARQRLATIIQNHGNVEYLGNCFSDAERKTDARVVMVYLKKQSEDDRLNLWKTDTLEKTPDTSIAPEDTMLAIKDSLGNMQHYYDMANTHMLTAFEHMRKAALYMEANSLLADTDAYKQIFPMSLRNTNSARAEFIRKHRHDAWIAVFQKMQFNKWLDKKQREEFIRDIELNANIPFTADNIKGTLENVIDQRQRLFEKSVANVFDELTRYHKGNTNHIEGWKTNDSYKVNTKLVFPWGCRFDAKFLGNFEGLYSGSAIDIYMDLDRIMAVLDHEPLEEILTIGTALEHKFRQLGHHVTAPFDNKCESRYFRIKFWKKGTVHLEFKHKQLWEKFNITAAAGKKWIGENTQEDK
jgi:hypothetical protein